MRKKARMVTLQVTSTGSGYKRILTESYERYRGVNGWINTFNNGDNLHAGDCICDNSAVGGRGDS